MIKIIFTVSDVGTAEARA